MKEDERHRRKWADHSRRHGKLSQGVFIENVKRLYSKVFSTKLFVFEDFITVKLEEFFSFWITNLHRLFTLLLVKHKMFQLAAMETFTIRIFKMFTFSTEICWTSRKWQCTQYTDVKDTKQWHQRSFYHLVNTLIVHGYSSKSK